MELDITQILTAAGAFALAFVTVWKTLRSNPKQNRGIDADTATKYEAIAARVADRNEQLILRIHNVEAKSYKMEEDLEKLSDLIVDWEVGINLLIDQLCEAGIDPVWRPNPSEIAKSS